MTLHINPGYQSALIIAQDSKPVVIAEIQQPLTLSLQTVIRGPKGDTGDPGPAGADGEQGPPGPITQTRLGLSVVAFDTNGAVTGVTHANGDTVAIGYNVDGEVTQVDKKLDGVNYRTTIAYSPTAIELNTVVL